MAWRRWLVKGAQAMCTPSAHGYDINIVLKQSMPSQDIRMSPSTQSTAVMIMTLVLYVLVPLFLLIKRWPLRAGLAMLVVTLLPVLWQAWFTDSDAPGFVFLLFMMIPIPLGIIAIGLLYAFYRTFLERSRKSKNR